MQLDYCKMRIILILICFLSKICEAGSRNLTKPLDRLCTSEDCMNWTNGRRWAQFATERYRNSIIECMDQCLAHECSAVHFDYLNNRCAMVNQNQKRDRSTEICNTCISAWKGNDLGPKEALNILAGYPQALKGGFILVKEVY